MSNTATVALMRHGGSHLIRPIVAKLGFDIIEPGNFGAPLDKSVGPVIVFLRDPRNRMVATLRWWRGKPRKAVVLSNGGTTDDEQLLYLLKQQGFLEEMLTWARVWCNWSDALYVHFEGMTISKIESISNHLGLPPDKERDKSIYNEVYGHSRTYTGSHSNWRDSFGPLSMGYWRNNDGNDLLRLMRYKA